MDAKQIKKLGGETFKIKIGEVTKLELDDQHHYWLDEKYLTSVTRILGAAAPVSPGLKQWWQQNTKEEADAIFETAGEFGSVMHDAFERLLNAETLLKKDYPHLRQQKFIASFMDWFKFAQPTNFEAEQIVASAEFEYAGTLDFVGDIEKSRGDWLSGNMRKPYAAPEKDTYERWLIDFKTSKSIHFSHELQVAAYKQAHEESTGQKIDRMGILHLNGTKNGWSFKEVDRPLDHFMNVYQTFKNMNGGKMPEPPELVTYPDKFQLLEKEAQDVEEKS